MSCLVGKIDDTVVRCAHKQTFVKNKCHVSRRQEQEHEPQQEQLAKCRMRIQQSNMFPALQKITSHKQRFQLVYDNITLVTKNKAPYTHSTAFGATQV